MDWIKKSERNIKSEVLSDLGKRESEIVKGLYSKSSKLRKQLWNLRNSIVQGYGSRTEQIKTDISYLLREINADFRGIY